MNGMSQIMNLKMRWNNISDAQKRHGSNVAIRISAAGLAGKTAHRDQLPFWVYISSSAKCMLRTLHVVKALKTSMDLI